MRIANTFLSGVKLITPSVFEDSRGYFMESYSFAKLSQHGIEIIFIQDNHSLSVEPFVIRGMHYQLEPFAQSKLIRATSGEIYDVVVDIRQDSPTFGKWEAFVLSAANKHQLFIPSGFAHGFCTLAPNTEVQYKVDVPYSPQHDRGIAWNDPALAIDWPTSNPILSEKDGKHPVLAEAEINFEYKG
ncbi:dTDP-4-dehydrorhamnose 3,5-epimerase [Paenibacillus harenae]|uniref:dTDP-4-dehydrorhamnose 3,5-epimerase n=1 Tax=Paenibacillus harenae TaxID=306543 RepID=A0ABT9U8B5_PAEHA|nr:dTDP-4-dehydrorhamnose 3,5-epimerase [Paenibacillus harenae]MDQ0115238.1 dTDP-4-dehydrorhamnose 3,5-epimerase [Paenibacillus harenae]